MDKGSKIIVALLAVIAIEGAYSANEIRRIAREGFSMELTVPQADTLATEVEKAKEAALLDMNEEGE